MDGRQPGRRPHWLSSHHLAVEHLDDTWGAGGEFGGVGGDDERGLALGAEGEEQCDDFVAGVRVEVAGRFGRPGAA